VWLFVNSFLWLACLGLVVSLPSSAVASRARAPQGRRLCRRGRRTQAHKPSRSLCV